MSGNRIQDALRVVAVACLAVSTPALGQTSYVRYHDGQPITLNLDMTRIAVFIEGDVDGSQAVIALTPFGIPAATIVPMALPGWSEAGTPPAMVGPGLIEALVGAIAGAGVVDFVTPVFLQDDGMPSMLTPLILVRFGTGVPPAQAQSILDPDGDGQEILEVDWAGMTGAYLVDGLSGNGFDVMTTANDLELHPLTTWAQVDWMHTTKSHYIPDDPLFSSAWHLLNTGQTDFGSCIGASVPDGTAGMDMQATFAWNYQQGDPNIVVAIFDTGIQQDHPDINQVVPGVDMTQVGGDGGPTTNWDDHGTAVAGCVSGIIDNEIGACGVAPGARVISIKIANTDANNNLTWQTSFVAIGLFECDNLGVRVTNHSYGIGGAGIDAIEDALDWTRNAGIIHFASAGNGGADQIGDPTLGFPASYSAVNAVAALDPDGTLTPWSNWGATLFVSAPGARVRTTDRTGSVGFGSGDYITACGTSFSSPLTAGAAALILSCDSNLTPDEVEDIMAQSATDLGQPGYDMMTGWGFVNAHEAVRMACFGGSCIDGPGGSCFETHSWPGCGDETCCMQVCTADPTCCDMLWDAQCADAAYELCGGCELAPSGPCDEPHGLPGCDDGQCCGAVCEFDLLCCSVEFGWDATCVAHAIELCDLGPANDDCTDAPEIFDGFTPFTIANAVNDGPGQLAECNWDNTFLKDIWYEYISTCTGTLEVSACTQTSYSTWVGVYADCGCPQDTLNLIDCAFADADCIGGEILNVPVEAGLCYKIRVAAGNIVLPSDGGGLVHIACRVPGDDVGDGSDLGSMEGTVTFDTQGATTDGPPHPDCLPAGDDQIHHDIWYLWTAPSSGTLTVDTCGAADFDTRLAVYDGCTAPPTDANLLGCNDDGTGCAGGTSRLNAPVVTGQCYRIRLGGAAGAMGTGQMTIALSTCPADLDGDNAVGITDFLLLLGSWGPCAGCPADLDGDDAVGITDFLLLLGSWGPCP